MSRIYLGDNKVQNTHRLSPRDNQTGNKLQSSLWRFWSQHSLFNAKECVLRELVKQQANPKGLSGIDTGVTFYISSRKLLEARKVVRDRKSFTIYYSPRPTRLRRMFSFTPQSIRATCISPVPELTWNGCLVETFRTRLIC